MESTFTKNGLIQVAPVPEAEAPKPIVRRSLNVIEFREGGGGLILFGSPFLAAGIFMFLIGLGVISSTGVGEWYLHIVLQVVGLIFGSVGAVLMFGRSWTVIDREAKGIVKAKGLLRPTLSQRFDLRGYGLVVLQYVAGDSDSPDQYLVVLKAGGDENMLLSRTNEFGAGYRQAAYVAEFLGMPLEDTTSDHVRRLSPTDLAAGMQERLKAETGQREYVAQPFDLQSQVERIDGELRITIPNKKYRLWQALPSFIPTAILLYAGPSVKEFFDSSETPLGIQIGILGFVLLFFVVAPLYSMVKGVLVSQFGYTRLTVSRRQLALCQKGVWRRKETVIELADVIDIDFQSATAQRAAARQAAQELAKSRNPGAGPTSIPPMLERLLNWANRLVRSKGMTIKSKQGLQYFGAGLPDEEIAYLTHMVREWLRSR
jgi:hypothetical protein